MGSSFSIYIHIYTIYVCIVCTTCGYSLLNECGTAMQSLCKIFAMFLLFFLSSFCPFLYCVFNLHLHSREINFLMHFHLNFRRFFCRFFLAICTYVCNCISLNYIRVYMAVLKNFPFCIFFSVFTCSFFILWFPFCFL